ncbi:hypothetical protein TNCV_1966481 [Trichonephila clavipes]|nr:hypothetical protein TNCV_1966481 [Trichonephila clavipes]
MVCSGWITDVKAVLGRHDASYAGALKCPIAALQYKGPSNESSIACDIVRCVYDSLEACLKTPFATWRPSRWYDCHCQHVLCPIA